MTPILSTRSSYVPAIDGLRAIAVTSVIVFHLWPRMLPGGFTGVDIFFVISGFVVTASLIGKQFAGIREFAAYFYARRLMRIMPALIAMLLVTLLAAQLFIPDGWLSRAIPQTARFAFFGLSNIVLATDTDSYFGPQAGYNPFTHTWSLGVEEQFYLLFPLLLFWHQRLHSGPKAVRVIAILTVASLLLCAVLGQISGKFAFYLIFSRFWELGAGMLLCLTRERWLGWAQRQRWLSWAGLALVAIGFALPEGRWFPFPFALLPVLGTSALIAGIVAGTAPRVLASKPLVATGLLSYSLYLWHWPVFVLFRWTSGLHTLSLQLTALAIAVAFAIASYFLIERPLRSSARIAAWPRGRVVRNALAGTVLAALAGFGLIAAHDRITLSVTGDRHAWYAEPERALDPALSRCGLADAEQRLYGGHITIWSPRGCAPAFTIFVPADSHGLAYAPALRQFAAQFGAPVRLYFRAGCPYFKLIETHAQRPACKPYYDAVLADIRGSARPGDVVFLPGMRLTRLANQFEGDTDLIGEHDDAISPAAFAEAKALAVQLSASGARLVLEAPKPIFPTPIFRCADWFNRWNPICASLTVPQPEMRARRAKVMRGMSELAVAVPALRLWDPLQILCPEDPCEALPGGRPLFFDGDHLSGLGNDRLYPDLRRVVLEAHNSRE